jgi:hypothetical protein
MNTFSEFDDSPFRPLGFEKALVLYVQKNGQITSLEKLAHDEGITPWWLRHCAHSAAKKGLIKLTRLEDQSGRPYRVSSLEEEKHDS